MNIRIFFILISIFISISIVDAEGPTTYLSYVDDVLGFYKVRNLDVPPQQFTYVDHTLNINQGDTVIWQNDAEKTTFTVLSEQNLWDSTVGYLRVASKVNYRFDKPGKYTIYIKEHTSRRQTIIVSALDGIPTPEETSPEETSPEETSIPAEIDTTPIQTIVTPESTISNPEVITPLPTTDLNIPAININMSGTMIASIIVAILSIFITYLVGRNK
jgi:plastocyanin